MKAFYYPLLLKQPLVKMPDGMASRFYIIYFLLSLIWLGQTAKAQFGSDLGAPAVSTLAWDHISSVGDDLSSAGSIGLTTDGRVYVWGTNFCYTIHTQQTGSGNTTQAVFQSTPYYLPSPAGERIVKVRLMANFLGGYFIPTYFALSQSGKLYGWGLNNGLVGTVSGWPNVNNTFPANSDTTKTIRKPVQLTILGESSFVEFDASPTNRMWVAIGASGKAYHIGTVGSGIPATTAFNVLPNPAGVGTGFKYIKVWVSKTVGSPLIYLKGNDGNIYYTGQMGGNYHSGVPSAYVGTTNTSSESQGQILTINPRLVPFPAGEDIVNVYAESQASSWVRSTYALSASGKAYLAGGWRFVQGPYATSYQTYVVAPLKNVPTAGTGLEVVVPGSSVVVNTDTVYLLKNFTEVAMPPGATKVLHFEGNSFNGNRPVISTIVGDNNKVYWSGFYNNNPGGTDSYVANFLAAGRDNPVPVDVYTCNFNYRFAANDYYTWKYEAINYRGAITVQNTNFSTGGVSQVLVLSKTRRGYFVGPLTANTGTGKVYYSANGGYISPYPVPIANEQLLSCNTSPGTGGPLGEPVSTPGVGVTDCSKTKLYPAPVQGTPSELSLLVTINVTTVGDFSPITISGSGMSLVSGFDKVTATTTGVQTFHIPIKYNGSTLTNNFQFIIGSAGSCSADLTNKPSNEITKVWSLNNCTAITPGVLSK